MLKSKKLLRLSVVLTLIFTMLFGTTAFAKEASAVASIETSSASASSTIVGPDGYTYTYLGTATRNGATNHPVEGHYTQLITASQKVHIVFYCPNNNRKDLVQGEVEAIPMMGGTVEKYSFLNYSNEVSDINLSNLPGTGPYRIDFSIYAIGTSNSGAVYYRVYQDI